MSPSKSVLSLLSLLLLNGSGVLAAPQAKPPKGTLDAKVSSFKLADQTIDSGLAKLAAENISLSFGFENDLKRQFADPTLPDVRFNLSPENASVKEILDALCSMDVRYTWSQDGETINVYPRSKLGDMSYFLNRRLATWVVNDITDIQQGLLAIVQQLPGPTEQVAIRQIGGALSFPSAWKETFHNITVRQAINRIAGQLGDRTFWQLSGSDDFRGFSFAKIGEHPRGN